MTTQGGSARQRNARGEGARLRRDLVAAAARVIEREGDLSAVTLRSVAREAGVAAPSIYAHFATPMAIAAAVLTDALAEFSAILGTAGAGVDGPRERLLARCQAYLDFARSKPRRHRMLFERPADAAAELLTDKGLLEECARSFEQFGALVHAAEIAGGRSGEAADVDATTLWAAMYGYIVLREGNPTLPWAEDDTATLTRMISGICGIPSE